MSNIISFITWFLTNIPDFLMSEPICYFVGLMLLAFVIGIIKSIVHISR